MKTHARLRLPPLATLDADSRIPYALLARTGDIEARGEYPLQQLADLDLPAVHVILHPDDAVVTNLVLPRLNRKRLDQAVTASIEPMLLDDPEQVIVAHGPQDRVSGQVPVAWVDRERLRQACAQLNKVGITPRSIVPSSVLTPRTDDTDSTLTALWQAPWPRWSLNDPGLHSPAASPRWQRCWPWVGAAAAVWIIGLNLYAARLDHQVQSLNQYIETSVKRSFPEIPVLLDPVKQAQQQLNLLRAQNQPAQQDPFARLALAASRLPEFAQGRVQSMQYQNGQLRLEVIPGSHQLETRYVSPGPHLSADLQIEKDTRTPHVWLIQPRPDTSGEVRR